MVFEPGPRCAGQVKYYVGELNGLIPPIIGTHPVEFRQPVAYVLGRVSSKCQGVPLADGDKSVPVDWTSPVSKYDEPTAAEPQLSGSGSGPAPPPVKRGVV